MYDDAASYRDCFRLISTLLQDRVDPWTVHTHTHMERVGERANDS